MPISPKNAKDDFTVAEARKAFADFARNIGPEALVSVSLSDSLREPPVRCYVYPRGVLHGSVFSVVADDFRSLLAALEAKWAEYTDVNAARISRNMALEIIRITAELGHCTDAALRTAKFTTDEIKRYGERAAADANEIAGNGPFRIVALAGANGAPEMEPSL